LSSRHGSHRDLHSFPTRRSSDLNTPKALANRKTVSARLAAGSVTSNPWTSADTENFSMAPVLKLRRVNSRVRTARVITGVVIGRSEEHTSELQSRENLVCRLLLE